MSKIDSLSVYGGAVTNPITRLLVLGGVVGPLLFIVVFLIEGATRPGYSAWRNYVSDLALSDQGWQQIANFIVCGLLVIGFSVGLRRVLRTGKASIAGPLLLGLFGVGLLVAGLFPTDPGRGYPPGAPLSGTPTTFHGWVHGINAIPVFLLLATLPFVLARRFADEPGAPAWATYSRIVGAVIILTFIGGNVIGPLSEHGVIPRLSGLVQRIQLITGWTWISSIAYHLLRRPVAILQP
jgi:hypothetical protein